MQVTAEKEDTVVTNDSRKLIIDCHIAEYDQMREEIKVFERRLYTLSAAYLGFFGALTSISVKVYSEAFMKQTELFYALILLLLFINSLYNIIASSLSLSIVRVAIYVKDSLTPKVNSILSSGAFPNPEVWHWESLLRSKDHIGKEYGGMVSLLLKYSEVIFAGIIFLPSLFFNPVLLSIFGIQIWDLKGWYQVALIFCCVLLVVSLFLGGGTLACYIRSGSSPVRTQLILGGFQHGKSEDSVNRS